MKKLRLSHVALATVVLTVLWCVWLLRPPELSHRTFEMDLNCGDIRSRTYVCNVRVRTTIRESLLSKEMRRLGIDVPKTRRWVPIGVDSKVSEFLSVYHDLPGIYHRLVELLRKTNTPDEERRVILEKAMSGLRTPLTGSSSLPEARIPHLVYDLAEKHRMEAPPTQGA
jgi:hypothetical protein